MADRDFSSKKSSLDRVAHMDDRQRPDPSHAGERGKILELLYARGERGNTPCLQEECQLRAPANLFKEGSEDGVVEALPVLRFHDCAFADDLGRIHHS